MEKEHAGITAPQRKMESMDEPELSDNIVANTTKQSENIQGQKQSKNPLKAIACSFGYYLCPAALVCIGVSIVISGYNPLMMDDTLIEQANAAQASAIDVGEPLNAETLEAENAASGQEEIDLSTTIFETPAGGYRDGTWRGTGYGYKSYITVDVTIQGGKIVSIVIVSEDDDAEYIAQAKAIIERVISAQSTNVDVVSGATYSSRGILEAIANALKQAALDSSTVETLITNAAVIAAVEQSAAGEIKTTSVTDPGISATEELADGTYLGYARCSDAEEFDYYVVVPVTIQNGKVAFIGDVYGSGTGDAGDVDLGTYDVINDPYLKWAASGRTIGSVTFTGVVSQITSDATQGVITTSVDVVSGATYSSKAILQGYFNALKKSAAAAGSTISVLDATDDNTWNDPTSGGENATENNTVLGNDAGGSNESTGSSSKGEASGTTGNGVYEHNTGIGNAGADDGDTVAMLIDGEYSAYALTANSAGDWDPYFIGVTIKVENSTVTSIVDIWGDADHIASPSYFYNAADNSYYLNRAINGYGLRTKGLMEKINTALASGTLGSTRIDVISGATYSSNAIIEAFYAAIDAAWAVAEEAASSAAGNTADNAGDNPDTGTDRSIGDDNIGSSTGAETSPAA